MQVWIEGGARPEIGNHHSAEVINNQLYLFGGLRGSSSLADVQIGTLTVATGVPAAVTWVQGADAPIATGSAISAYINGEVLAALQGYHPCGHLVNSVHGCMNRVSQLVARTFTLNSNLNLRCVHGTSAVQTRWDFSLRNRKIHPKAGLCRLRSLFDDNWAVRRCCTVEASRAVRRSVRVKSMIHLLTAG